MDRLTAKINELHATLDYADYSELMDLADELKAENAQLRAENNKLLNNTEELIKTSIREGAQIRIVEQSELDKITAGIPLDRLKEICEEERTAEYSSYQTLDYARERAYIITRNGMNFEAIQGENACERAEARLRELRGEKQ